MRRPSHGGNLAWAAAVTNCSPQEILDFSASINPLGPPASAIACLQDQALLTHYPDPNCGALRVALSEYHKIPSDWILPGNGAAELLTWIGRDLATYDQISVLVPGFQDYFRALKSYGSQIVPLPIERVNDQLEAQGGLPQASHSAVILNDPHNPTGKRLSPTFIQACLDQFDYVVIDEAFLDFVNPQEQNSALQYLERYPQLVILRSLTKFYSLPGLRIGYAIAHPDILKRWQQWRDPWSVNALAIEMGAACVRDFQFQQRVWEWLPRVRSQLYEDLDKIPGLHPESSVANFILIRSEEEILSLQLTLLQKYNILIRDCLSFPELGDHYFRVAVLNPSQNHRLIAALNEELSVAETRF